MEFVDFAGADNQSSRISVRDAYRAHGRRLPVEGASHSVRQLRLDELHWQGPGSRAGGLHTARPAGQLSGLGDQRPEQLARLPVGRDRLRRVAGQHSRQHLLESQCESLEERRQVLGL